MNQPQILTNWINLRTRLGRYLTPSLFKRLHRLPDNLEGLTKEAESEAVAILQEVTEALNPLHRVLVHYMPRYLLELDPTPNQPHGEMLSGSFIFADVSGFTALTEMLSRAGDAKGRELMNQIMNRLFSTVLDPITASGGDMLIFVGDAALVYFPEEEDGRDVLLAVRAALRMQRAIEPFIYLETELGSCSLTMSIGIEQGSAYAAVVGTHDRMELLVSGPGTFGAMKAEVEALSGQVLLGPTAMKIAASEFTFEGSVVLDNMGDELGDYEITHPTRKRGSSMYFGRTTIEILETLETNLQRVERLAPFLPEDMLALLINTERRRKLQSEFRPVAVQFINVLGVEELAVIHGPQLATEVFQQYFTHVKQIAAQHEGIISQIDAYISGFFFLNTFGVPKSHEGTTRYAVSAALQMAQALERINQQFQLDPPLRQRGGITYGLTFNGEIGAAYRRESVIAGPAVNRAARLMSKAEAGQVILDSVIWEQTRNAFVGEELPPVQLKGIDGDVFIINVKNIRLGTRLPPLERPMIERQAEQGVLQQAMQRLIEQRRSSAWVIYGETGIGKTTLLSSFAELVQPQPLTLLVGYCQPHSKYMPLYPWLDLLINWFDLDMTEEPQVQRAKLRQKVVAHNLTALEEDLAKLLIIDTNTTSLANNTHLAGVSLIFELLEQLSLQQPLVIILEDAHWLDSESQALLGQLLKELHTWNIMLLLTGHEALGMSNLTPISLTALPNTAQQEIVNRAFQADTVDETLSNWICQKAGGNPLYAGELCRALLRSEAVWLDKSSGEIHWTGLIPGLPLTLHELLLARLDALPLTQQELLKRCSILGLSAEAHTLAQLCLPHISHNEMQQALDEVVLAAILKSERTFYTFTHPLMQEAIYATLSFQQRQTWHGIAANWLVEQNPDKYLENIVYHYMNSANIRQAAEYGLLAGDKAREREAYAGAIDYYQQVYGLLDAPTKLRMTALEKQGDVLALQGNYGMAVNLYQQAMTLGGESAAGKHALMSGNLETLADDIFDDRLKLWAAGARAWLLAQAGQTDEALLIIRPAEEVAQGAAHTALSVLAENIQNKRSLAPYREWLDRFVNAVLNLGLSTIDLLDMPDAESEIVNKLARRRRMTVEELAAELAQPVVAVQIILNDLVQKGNVKQMQTGDEIWYKAQFARKAKKRLASDLWSALDL